MFRCAILFLGFVPLCACNKAKGAQALAQRVASVPCFSTDVEKDLANAGERLDSLSKDESRDADQALVMLIGYYLGEHNAEELHSEIVRRGRRMTPLLVEEERNPARLSTCAPSLERDTLRFLTRDALEAIAKGE